MGVACGPRGGCGCTERGAGRGRVCRTGVTLRLCPAGVAWEWNGGRLLLWGEEGDRRVSEAEVTFSQPAPGCSPIRGVGTDDRDRRRGPRGQSRAPCAPGPRRTHSADPTHHIARPGAPLPLPGEADAGPHMVAPSEGAAGVEGGGCGCGWDSCGPGATGRPGHGLCQGWVRGCQGQGRTGVTCAPLGPAPVGACLACGVAVSSPGAPFPLWPPSLVWEEPARR